MERVRNFIPNLLTLGNLACGLVGIIVLFEVGEMPLKTHLVVAYLMVGAMACDFLDGFVARALKATSPIGKELDSLSDLVSFGVLPGMMVYSILKMQTQGNWLGSDNYIGGEDGLPPTAEQLQAILNPWWLQALPFVGLIIPLFSAYRLAKFNIDTRQSYGFLGLPTPANALFFLSVFMIYSEATHLGEEVPRRYYTFDDFQFVRFDAYLSPFDWLHHPFVLIGLTLLFSVLLVTEIPLLAMKFKDYSFRNNWPRYVLILVSITLLAIFWIKAIPLIIVCYFIFSFIDTRLQKHL